MNLGNLSPSPGGGVDLQGRSSCKLMVMAGMRKSFANSNAKYHATVQPMIKSGFQFSIKWYNAAISSSIICGSSKVVLAC